MAIAYLGPVGSGTGSSLTLTMDIPQSTPDVAYWCIVRGAAAVQTGGNFQIPSYIYISDQSVITKTPGTYCYGINEWNTHFAYTPTQHNYVSVGILESIGGGSYDMNFMNAEFSCIIKQPLPAGTSLFFQGFDDSSVPNVTLGSPADISTWQWNAFLFSGVDGANSWGGFGPVNGRAASTSTLSPTTDCLGTFCPNASYSNPNPTAPTAQLVLASGFCDGKSTSSADPTPCLGDPGLPTWAFTDLCSFSDTWVTTSGCTTTWRLVYGYLLAGATTIATQFACPGHFVTPLGVTVYRHVVTEAEARLVVPGVGPSCTPIDMRFQNKVRVAPGE